jgi:hypothetical protein
MPTVLQNGESYAWSQIDCKILGASVAGITKITYNDAQEIQDNKGAGNKVISRGYGAIECTGSLTLEMNELERLQAIAPNGRIQEIPEFDIIVSFVPFGSNATVTHTLKNCRFKENGRDISTGDMTVTKDIPLQIAEIKWR